jgi:hypothetical protein
MKRLFPSWLIAFVILSAGQQVFADRFRSNNAAMNWSDTTKWEVSTDGGSSWNVASTYPAQIFTDTVSVRTGHIVTLDTTLSIAVDSLEIVGTLRIGNNAVSRSFSVRNVSILGTFAAGNNTASHSLSINGDWTNNGTWTAVSGTGLIAVTFTGSGNSIIGGTAAYPNHSMPSRSIKILSTTPSWSAEVRPHLFCPEL